MNLSTDSLPVHDEYLQIDPLSMICINQNAKHLNIPYLIVNFMYMYISNGRGVK